MAPLCLVDLDLTRKINNTSINTLRFELIMIDKPVPCHAGELRGSPQCTSPQAINAEDLLPAQQRQKKPQEKVGQEEER
ncbi:hypothetical protein HYALB_00002996 [Hymenoscyphus albidus]|uniref:Uncharacterized protein n=1 Tax=Hymenoscyphus albidus TaxID=595503 RepID=A0A9N9M4L9_9HELO|nr:hypothetical protein HYALB_00002996 [Hymenoscyphus albidus]